MTEARSLHRKLAQIMYEAERIPKNGTAPAAMGGYKFVQVGDAADFIRKALAEHVLTMMPTKVTIVGQQDRPTKAGGMMTTTDLLVEWTITDGESGESTTIESFGAGADGGDKYSGKASTSAMKYALLTGFLLSTGEDAELGTHEAAAKPEKAPEPVLVPLGEQTHTGRVAKGDGENNDLEFHADPNGYRFGFKLVIGDGQSIPQVICTGPIGTALLGAGIELLGQTVTVTGEAFRVETPGRRAYRRLMVEMIEGDGFKVPAGPVEPPDGKTDDLDKLPF